MDEEIKKLATTWIESKKTIRSCDCCGQNTWSLSEDIVTNPVFSRGELIIGGKSYPHILLICNNCGNTKFFNAVKMGIMTLVKEGDS